MPKLPGTWAGGAPIPRRLYDRTGRDCRSDRARFRRYVIHCGRMPTRPEFPTKKLVHIWSISAVKERAAAFTVR